MAQRLKRWESPRREGRNHRGKGGSARQRQLLKQQKQLRQKLKGKSADHPDPPGRYQFSPERREFDSLLFLWL